MNNSQALTNKKIVLICGEISGTDIAIDLIEQLKILGCQNFAGIGSSKIKNYGVDLWFDSSVLSIMGITDALLAYRKIKKIQNNLIKRIIDYQPDIVFGVDIPSFNLALEQKLKKKGFKCVQVVCPQFWAWNYKRVYSFHKKTDCMFTLFPFESKLLDKHNMPNTCIGHHLATKKKRLIQNEAKEKLHIIDNKKILALFPGSRNQEIKLILPLHLKILYEFFAKKANKNTRVIIAATNKHFAKSIKNYFENKKYQHLINYEYTIYTEQTDEIIVAADFCLVTSGTITLEIMLQGKLMSVIYQKGLIDMIIIRCLIGKLDIVLANFHHPKLNIVSRSFFHLWYTQKNIKAIVQNLEYNSDIPKDELNAYQKISQEVQQELLPNPERIRQGILELLK